MKVSKEISLCSFEFWGGAELFADKLTNDELLQVETCIDEQYPDGVDETELNDIFRFEPETVCEWLGLDYNEVENR